MRLIDADALKEEWIKDTGRAFPADYFIFTIIRSPTIDPVPVVHSEWMSWTTSAYIGRGENNEPKYADQKYFRCRKCRYGSIVASNYCPNCGAKM